MRAPLRAGLVIGTWILLAGAAPDSVGVVIPILGPPPLPVMVPAPPEADPCALPPRLPAVDLVEDPVFAILLGLIEENRCGTISGARLRREIHLTGRDTRMPVQYLDSLSRTLRPGFPQAEVELVSRQELDLPVPYKVLSYEPGRIRASRVLELEEWRLGTLRLGSPDQGGGPGVILTDVRIWGVRTGTVDLDIDGWLDRLMGSRLDDTRIVGFALFRYSGKRIGMALGYNRNGRGHSGAFDFEKDGIIFPSPPPLKLAGAHLRGRLERLLPQVTARRHR